MNKSKGTRNNSYTTTETALATASSVEELTSLLPGLRKDLHTIESNFNNALSEITTGSTTLETCVTEFIAIKDEITEALEGEVEWIGENNFPNAKQRQQYINSVETALTSIKQISDHIVSFEDLKSSLIKINTMLEKLISTQTSTFRKIEDLLPKHESYELGMWYQQAREKTKIKPYYIGFFVVLLCLIGIIFASLQISTNGTESGAWYESLSQSGTLRLSLVVAFSGTLIFLGKQISSQKRIYEEYGHKETMMKTFRGFSSKLASIRDTLLEENAATSLPNALEIKAKTIEVEIALLAAVIDIMKSNPAEAIQPSTSVLRLKRNKETTQN